MPISCSCCVAIITKFETQFVYNFYLLEEYFSYTQIDWDANPFEWWNMYKSKFPICMKVLMYFSYFYFKRKIVFGCWKYDDCEKDIFKSDFI